MRIVAILFALGCLCLWYPIKVYLPLLGTERVDPRPAGEITSRFEAIEVVNKTGEIIDPAKRGLCLGLRFATFRRRNAGQFKVAWQQAGKEESWEVGSDTLDDNEFRYFCPDADFNPSEPFVISVKGKVGVPGVSPTVWLTSDSRLGSAVINGHANTRGLDLVIARERRRSPLELAEKDHGAFLTASLCTLFIGLLSLAWVGRRRG